MDELITRRTLAATGNSDRDIRKQLCRGTLRRIDRDVYTRSPVAAPWVEFRLRSRAVGMRGGVLSHQSAAAIHAIPCYGYPTKRVHTTVDRPSGGGVRGRVHVHPRPLPESDVVVVDGIRVTSRARTAIDLAMTGDHGQALAALDGVRLRRRYPRPTDPPVVTVDELERAAEVLGPRSGVRMLRRALGESVERSESAGESRSRAMMIEWGLPLPRLQQRFVINGRQYFADFTWPGLIGEFDGMRKYQEDEERIVQQARRAGDFRSIGIAVVNWWWEDLADRRRIFDILTNELVRSAVIDRIPMFPG